MAERAMDMAAACVASLRRAADTADQVAAARPVPLHPPLVPPCRARAARPQAEALSVDGILRGIHYFRVHNASEQRAVIELLQGFLQTHPRARDAAAPARAGAARP